MKVQRLRIERTEAERLAVKKVAKAAIKQISEAKILI